ELEAARVVTTAIVNGEPQTAVELVEGVNRHRFGEGLEPVEQLWLAGQINTHLAELKGVQDVDYGSLPPPEPPKIINDDSSSSSSSLTSSTTGEQYDSDAWR
ncbi:hypothetical protein Agub_g10087, partial [Astrephomene gubernaculifera]